MRGSTSLDADPLATLQAWLEEAREAQSLRARGGGARDRDAAEGTPSVRMVLVRGIDARGLALLHEPREPEGRGARSEPRGARSSSTGGRRSGVRPGSRGRWSGSTEEESLAYFRTRARTSRLGAWASPQSRPLADRDELDARYAAAEAALRRRGRRPAAAVLGRLSPSARRDRALAEPAEPAARPRALRARGGRLVAREARAVASRTAARARASCRRRGRSRAGSPSRPGAGRRGSAAAPAPGS